MGMPLKCGETWFLLTCHWAFAGGQSIEGVQVGVTVEPPAGVSVPLSAGNIITPASAVWIDGR